MMQNLPFMTLSYCSAKFLSSRFILADRREELIRSGDMRKTLLVFCTGGQYAGVGALLILVAAVLAPIGVSNSTQIIATIFLVALGIAVNHAIRGWQRRQIKSSGQVKGGAKGLVLVQYVGFVALLTLGSVIVQYVTGRNNLEFQARGVDLVSAVFSGLFGIPVNYWLGRYDRARWSEAR